MTPDFWIGVLVGAIAGGVAIASLILTTVRNRQSPTVDRQQ